MKNLTPEQLSLHLSHGDWVAMKNTDGNWKVFMYETQEWGFQGTTTRCSIEESLESGLISPSYSPEQITEDFTEYQIIKRPPVLMEPGDKCQIIDTPELRKIAEEERWSDEKKEMIKQKRLKIEEAGSCDYDIYNKDESDWFTFPHWAVARDFSEEETISLSDEELKAEMERRGLLVDGKVLK